MEKQWQPYLENGMRASITWLENVLEREKNLSLYQKLACSGSGASLPNMPPDITSLVLPSHWMKSPLVWRWLFWQHHCIFPTCTLCLLHTCMVRSYYLHACFVWLTFSNLSKYSHTNTVIHMIERSFPWFIRLCFVAILEFPKNCKIIKHVLCTQFCLDCAFWMCVSISQFFGIYWFIIKFLCRKSCLQQIRGSDLTKGVWKMGSMRWQIQKSCG